MNNNHLRKIWDQRAEVHFARKMCKTEDKCSKLYDESWCSQTYHRKCFTMPEISLSNAVLLINCPLWNLISVICIRC